MNNIMALWTNNLISDTIRLKKTLELAGENGIWKLDANFCLFGFTSLIRRVSEVITVLRTDSLYYMRTFLQAKIFFFIL
jgi:hypothetical protein